MNHLFSFLLVVILSTTLSYSQSKMPRFNNDEKVYFGGGINFNSAGGVTYLGLSPLVGYKITDEFSGGMQLSMQYLRSRYSTFSTSIYGGGPFISYLFSPNLFGYSQYEYLSFPSSTTDRLPFSSWFVGIGYNSPISRKVAFQILGLYNLNHGDGTKSPYESPIQFRVGLVSGF